MTVRGHHGNFGACADLGSLFAAWMLRVATNEARHDLEFLGLLLEHLPEDLEWAGQVLPAVRGGEGEPHRAAFVPDEDESVYRSDLFVEAA